MEMNSTGFERRGVKRPAENSQTDCGSCTIQKCINCKEESDTFVPVVCSHVFCTQCYNRLFADLEPGGQARCPEDGRVIVPDYGVISSASGGNVELVPKVRMPCTNKERGCDKMIFFHDMELHLNSCVHRLLPSCPQGCNENVVYKDLVTHLTLSCDCRLVKCQFCKDDVSLNMIEKHEFQCPLKPVTCPHCNMEKILQKELHFHIETCPMSPGTCIMREMGCAFEGTKKDIEVHQTSWKYHIDVLVKCISSLQEQVNDLSNRIDELQHNGVPASQTNSPRNSQQQRKDTSTVCLDGVYLWQIKSVSKMITTKQDFLSPKFYMYEHGYHMRLHLRIRKEVSLRISVEEGANDGSLSWPFAQKMKVMILDRYADFHHTVEVDPNVSTENFCLQEIKSCKWAGKLKNLIEPQQLLCRESPFLRNDSMNIKFIVLK